MKMLVVMGCTALLLFSFPAKIASQVVDEYKTESNIDISGFGYFMFGQMASGFLGEIEKQKDWWSFGATQLRVTSSPNNWFTTRVGLELQTQNWHDQTDMDANARYLDYRLSIPMAEGIFHWNFDNDILSSLVLETGLFQYTFNPEVKNLGNYLHRATAYPLYIESRVDYPWADLMGARLQLGFLENSLKVETLLNSRYKYTPIHDWNLGFTATYSIGDVLDLGSGIIFDHAFSVNDEITMGKYQFPILDTANGDTTGYHSFKATKLDFRVAMDPKVFFGSPGIFGKEDLKIYGELAVLGLEDYQYPEHQVSWDTLASNKSLLRRMPMVVGFNIPSFKIVDVFSAEVEWFGSPYSNNINGGSNDTRPIPEGPKSSEPVWLDNYQTGDNIKWSFYVSKKISNLELIGILANDHTIYETYTAVANPSFEQSLRRKGDWHWYIKLKYNI